MSSQSQTVTNSSLFSPAPADAPAPAKGPMVTDSQGHEILPEDAKWLKSQGIDPSTVTLVDTNLQAQQQAALSPTPADLKNAIVYIDSFLGMTNAMLPADVISMKPESLKFRINGQDYDYSGHYTVTLNTPRQHKTPYFGFGSTETAKILILEDWGGNALPLQNATIWEKSKGFIDAVAMDKEWILLGYLHNPKLIHPLCTVRMIGRIVRCRLLSYEVEYYDCRHDNFLCLRTCWTWKPKRPNDQANLELRNWWWSCGNRKNIEVGSRVFLLRQGKDFPGIVASGWVSEGSFEADHWDPAKRKLRRQAWYITVDGKDTDKVHDLTSDALPRTRLIDESILPVNLIDSQASGVELPPECVENLERQWAKHLKKPIWTACLTDNSISALEGGLIEARIYRHKRNARLKRAALNASGGVCSVCDVDFSKVLGGKGARVLHAHHKLQLSQFSVPTITTEQDLAVVCANCHALIHINPKKALTIPSLRSMLRR